MVSTAVKPRSKKIILKITASDDDQYLYRALQESRRRSSRSSLDDQVMYLLKLVYGMFPLNQYILNPRSCGLTSWPIPTSLDDHVKATVNKALERIADLEQTSKARAHRHKTTRLLHLVPKQKEA